MTCPEPSGFIYFVFFVGGALVMTLARELLPLAKDLFEPPVEQERDRWGGE